jgi:aminopeptidase
VEYRSFVYDAVVRDWAAVSRRQAPLCRLLDDADTVTLVGPNTDLQLSVTGMNVFSGIGDFNNLPDGEVGTAPNPDSVSGHLAVDFPVRVRGVELTGVELTFEAGRVVSISADEDVGALRAMLDTDEGARRLGEFGIGTNDAIDRYTGNILFDEKMVGTVHVALGQAYGYTVGEGREWNRSAIHLDVLKDLRRPEVELRFDGEPVDPARYY